MDAIFIFHFGYFLPFYFQNPQKKQIFLKNVKKKKKKKTQLEAGDTIILHKYNKIHDHMLYCSWDMAHDGCNCYFSFWAIFCPFTPLTAQKTKI